MRSITPLDRVVEFHKAFGGALNEELRSGKTLSLRMDLITEEFEELRRACVDAVFSQGKSPDDKVSKEALAEVLKELCDLLYVCYGFAATFGLPVNEAFNRVHESNMSKLGSDGKPVYREDGKVLKGKNYWKPDIEGLFE